MALDMSPYNNIRKPLKNFRAKTVAFKGQELIQSIKHKFRIKSRPFGLRFKQRTYELNVSQICSDIKGWSPLSPTFKGSTKVKSNPKTKGGF